jgi:hypothetical protein
MEWLVNHFEVMAEFADHWLVRSLVSVLESIRGATAELFLKIEGILKLLLRSILLKAQLHRSLLVRALHTPLRLNPQSLHPIGLTTRRSFGLLV